MIRTYQNGITDRHIPQKEKPENNTLKTLSDGTKEVKPPEEKPHSTKLNQPVHA